MGISPPFLKMWLSQWLWKDRISAAPFYRWESRGPGRIPGLLDVQGLACGFLAVLACLPHAPYSGLGKGFAWCPLPTPRACVKPSTWFPRWCKVRVSVGSCQEPVLTTRTPERSGGSPSNQGEGSAVTEIYFHGARWAILISCLHYASGRQEIPKRLCLGNSCFSRCPRCSGDTSAVRCARESSPFWLFQPWLPHMCAELIPELWSPPGQN